MHMIRLSRLLQLGVLLLLVALIAQAGIWIGTQKTPVASAPPANAPKPAAVSGSSQNGSGTVADTTPPFIVGKDVKHDVSPPMRSPRAYAKCPNRAAKARPTHVQ